VRKHGNVAENSGYVHYRRLVEILGEVQNVIKVQNVGEVQNVNQNVGSGQNVQMTLKLMFSRSKDQLTNIMTNQL